MYLFLHYLIQNIAFYAPFKHKRKKEREKTKQHLTEAKQKFVRINEFEMRSLSPTMEGMLYGYSVRKPWYVGTSDPSYRNTEPH